MTTDYNDLLQEYMDGSLSRELEDSLFAELSANAALRQDLSHFLAFRKALVQEAGRNTLTPDMTNSVFQSLGYSAPLSGFANDTNPDKKNRPAVWHNAFIKHTGKLLSYVVLCSLSVLLTIIALRSSGGEAILTQAHNNTSLSPFANSTSNSVISPQRSVSENPPSPIPTVYAEETRTARIGCPPYMRYRRETTGGLFHASEGNSRYSSQNNDSPESALLSKDMNADAQDDAIVLNAPTLNKAFFMASRAAEGGGETNAISFPAQPDRMIVPQSLDAESLAPAMGAILYYDLSFNTVVNTGSGDASLNAGLLENMEVIGYANLDLKNAVGLQVGRETFMRNLDSNMIAASQEYWAGISYRHFAGDVRILDFICPTIAASVGYSNQGSVISKASVGLNIEVYKYWGVAVGAEESLYIPSVGGFARASNQSRFYCGMRVRI